MNGEGSLLAAANWLMELTQGRLAAILATIAIAGVGFSLLQGRLSVRRGLTALAGCCLLFGAAQLAGALLGVANSAGGTAPNAGQASFDLPEPASPPPVKPAPPADPYAGASVVQ